MFRYNSLMRDVILDECRGYIHIWKTIIEPKDKLMKKIKIVHTNPNCKDASKCNPHGEHGTVTYKKGAK
jgi:hypothetical protein